MTPKDSWYEIIHACRWRNKSSRTSGVECGRDTSNQIVTAISRLGSRKDAM
ncbi:predicted protein [Botrytis cinerea T4]|uniref:Uncharacterized protein n=1 Tax=Botryotinia fuckeliana (strain T4) TaxID=999810 RepID=G2Y6P3_BOTF4|nr:predicted protein [Botrytis cinerea T4]